MCVLVCVCACLLNCHLSNSRRGIAAEELWDLTDHWSGISYWDLISELKMSLM